MIVREFAAKIVDDFENRWFELAAINENITLAEAREYYDGATFQEFAKRISGKPVTIQENRYDIGTTDYFEQIDNNFVVSPKLWEEI